MFNTLVTSLQSILSRGFWLGSFVPVVLAVMAHLALGQWVLEGTRLDGVLSEEGPLAKAGAAFVLLIGLAFALGSLIPLLRGAMDGSLLPDWLHDALRRRRVRAARRVREGNRASDRLVAAMDRLLEGELPRLWAARDAGRALGRAEAVDLIDEAGTALGAPAARHQRAQPAEAGELGAAIAAMIAALSANAAGLPDGHPDHPASRRLSGLFDRLVAMLRDGADDAAARADIRAARHAMLALEQPRATRFGDARHIAERRCLDLYGIDFDYLWPRLGAHLAADETESKRLDAAQASVDFAVLGLWLSLSVPVTWLPILLWRHDWPGSALPLVVAGPVAVLVSALLYDLAVQTQFAFAATVKTIVDRYRFDVLTDLRLALPATRSAERELWGRLRGIEARGGDDLFYDHPPGAEAAP